MDMGTRVAGGLVRVFLLSYVLGDLVRGAGVEREPEHPKCPAGEMSLCLSFGQRG